MSDILAFAAAHWPWIIAYPLIGAFLTGLFNDDPGAPDLLLNVLIWPLLLAGTLGSIIREWFA